MKCTMAEEIKMGSEKEGLRREEHEYYYAITVGFLDLECRHKPDWSTDNQLQCPSHALLASAPPFYPP
jgi:hypothetical protein